MQREYFSSSSFSVCALFFFGHCGCLVKPAIPLLKLFDFLLGYAVEFMRLRHAFHIETVILNVD